MQLNICKFFLTKNFKRLIIPLFSIPLNVGLLLWLICLQPTERYSLMTRKDIVPDKCDQNVCTIMMYLPVAQSAINVWACFLSMGLFSFLTGSWNRKWSMKSRGVNEARSHLSLFKTSSSICCWWMRTKGQVQVWQTDAGLIKESNRWFGWLLKPWSEFDDIPATEKVWWSCPCRCRVSQQWVGLSLLIWMPGTYRLLPVTVSGSS